MLQLDAGLRRLQWLRYSCLSFSLVTITPDGGMQRTIFFLGGDAKNDNNQDVTKTTTRN